jgi:perosamine synthetase
VHAWHLYPIRVSPLLAGGRDLVATALAELGIGTSVHFIPIHKLGYFRRFVTRSNEAMPGAEALFPTLLSLPMYPRLKDEQVDAVCDALTELSQSDISLEEVR